MVITDHLLAIAVSKVDADRVGHVFSDTLTFAPIRPLDNVLSTRCDLNRGLSIFAERLPVQWSVERMAIIAFQ